MLNRVLFILIFISTKALIYAKARGIINSKFDTVTVIPDEYQSPTFNQSEMNLVLNPTDIPSDVLIKLNKGRGHIHKRRKFLKHLYPILMAALFAKLVVVPLVLKLLIATTSSAFVMSKIALVTSALIALSWLLGATRERAKLQIVQYPGLNTSKKFYGGWNVKEKNTSPQGPYKDWAYDDTVVEGSDKSFFL